MTHEDPLEAQPTIICAICDEYGSENREDFDWDHGVPVCMACMVEADDDEPFLNLGFEEAIDPMDGEAERDTG